MNLLDRVLKFGLLLVVAASFLACQSDSGEPSGQASDSAGPDYLVYLGTYTRGDNGSQGVYAARMNAATGELSEPVLAAVTDNPSFLAIHPNRRYVYTANEMAGAEGFVGAFEIVDPQTGELRALNTVPSGGRSPCHLSVDRTGKYLVVANFAGGTVSMFPIRDDGSLGESVAFFRHAGSSVDPKRQTGPFAHSANFSPDNRFVAVADLGLDQVLVYRFDAAAGTLVTHDPPFTTVKPGSGPRHFAFHMDQGNAYVINELASTVTAFSYDEAAGTLTEIQTLSTLPEDFEGTNHTAEVQVHPSGKFLYGSNRGHNSIAVFSIEPGQGTLTLVEQVSTQGEMPRNFGIDPSGNFLQAANRNTGNVVAFRIDQQTGRLTPTGSQIHLASPVCVRFVEPAD